MKKFVIHSIFLSLFWFVYPQEAWCSDCKQCNKRAVELRKRLLEQQKETQAEPQGYDVSMTDWNKTDEREKKEEDRKKKRKKKKEDKDKSKNVSFIEK